jgi:HSP20 family protein
MLMRTDPYRELDRLTRAVWGPQGRPEAMPMTAYRQDGTFLVHVDLPGVSPEAIETTVERNVLTIRAERSPSIPEGGERLLDERSYGTFSRQLVLDDTLAIDDITASWEAGVLTLTIPVAEPARPRKVQVRGAEEVTERTT